MWEVIWITAFLLISGLFAIVLLIVVLDPRRYCALIKRVRIKNLLVLKQIWTNRFPPKEPKEHTWLEKLLITPILIIRVFSLSNLVAFLSPDGRHRLSFIDLYVALWVVGISVLLFAWSPAAWWVVIIAGYRVLDTVNYHLSIFLVDSQRPTHRPASLQRSFLFAFVNLYEIVASYAVIYLSIGNIVDTSPKAVPMDTPIRAFYYSLVTTATLGGEFVPADDLSRGIVVAQVITAILFLIGVLPAVVSNLMGQIAGRQNRDVGGEY